MSSLLKYLYREEFSLEQANLGDNSFESGLSDLSDINESIDSVKYILSSMESYRGNVDHHIVDLYVDRLSGLIGDSLSNESESNYLPVPASNLLPAVITSDKDAESRWSKLVRWLKDFINWLVEKGRAAGKKLMDMYNNFVNKHKIITAKEVAFSKERLKSFRATMGRVDSTKPLPPFKILNNVANFFYVHAVPVLGGYMSSAFDPEGAFGQVDKLMSQIDAEANYILKEVSLGKDKSHIGYNFTSMAITHNAFFVHNNGNIEIKYKKSFNDRRDFSVESISHREMMSIIKGGDVLIDKIGNLINNDLDEYGKLMSAAINGKLTEKNMNKYIGNLSSQGNFDKNVELMVRSMTNNTEGLLRACELISKLIYAASKNLILLMKALVMFIVPANEAIGI